MEKFLISRLNSLHDEETVFLRNLEADVIKNAKNPNFTIAGARVHKGKNDISLHIHSRYESFPLHKHDFVEMMTVVSGNITHHINGRTISLGVGDILLMNKHVAHSIDETGADDIGINFIISDTFLNAVAPDISDTFFLDFVKENSKERGEAAHLWFKTAEHKQIGNLIENLVYELTEEKFDHTVLTRTISLLMRYLSIGGKALLTDGGVYDKISARKMVTSSYISGSYRNASLTELANKMYLSPQYLSKLIKELFGKSFKELLIDERMRRARELLIKTNLPINSIIQSVGYDNESYFHREYKTRFGKTPLATRKETK